MLCIIGLPFLPTITGRNIETIYTLAWVGLALLALTAHIRRAELGRSQRATEKKHVSVARTKQQRRQQQGMK